MENRFVIVRGGGDLATGTVQALWRAGFFVLILEAERPSAIRRQVALSEAVYDGLACVEDVTCVRCRTDGDIQAAWQQGYVPLLIDPEGLAIGQRNPAVVVDAILAKRNLGTQAAWDANGLIGENGIRPGPTLIMSLKRSGAITWAVSLRRERQLRTRAYPVPLPARQRNGSCTARQQVFCMASYRLAIR